MKVTQKQFRFTLIGAAMVALSACGGGGTGSVGVGASPTIALSTTVMDGLIQNALVCVDANNNGLCDPGEVQGRTDANGQVTLTVASGDVATAKLVAMVGTDAVDADTGPVKTPYTLSAPAGKHDVITPLTTMVQAKVEADHAAGKETSVDDAASFVQSGLNLKVSAFDNYIANRGTNRDSDEAGKHAHALAVLAQASNCGWTPHADSHGEDDGEMEAAHKNETHIQTGMLDKLHDVGSIDFSHSSCAAGVGESCDDFIKSQVAAVPATTCTPNPAPMPTPAPAPGPAPSPSPSPSPSPAPSPAPTPSVSAANGKVLYAANCTGCHGANPALGANGILNGANSPSTILNAISSNRGGMSFLAANIGAPQAADLAAYLATPGI